MITPLHLGDKSLNTAGKDFASIFVVHKLFAVGLVDVLKKRVTVQVGHVLVLQLRSFGLTSARHAFRWMSLDRRASLDNRLILAGLHLACVVLSDFVSRSRVLCFFSRFFLNNVLVCTQLGRAFFL